MKTLVLSAHRLTQGRFITSLPFLFFLQPQKNKVNLKVLAFHGEKKWREAARRRLGPFLLQRGGFYGFDSGPITETNTVWWSKVPLSLCVCCPVLTKSLFTWGRKIPANLCSDLTLKFWKRRSESLDILVFEVLFLHYFEIGWIPKSLV